MFSCASLCFFVRCFSFILLCVLCVLSARASHTICCFRFSSLNLSSHPRNAPFICALASFPLYLSHLSLYLWICTNFRQSLSEKCKRIAMRDAGVRCMFKERASRREKDTKMTLCDLPQIDSSFRSFAAFAFTWRCTLTAAAVVAATQFGIDVIVLLYLHSSPLFQPICCFKGYGILKKRKFSAGRRTLFHIYRSIHLSKAR